MPRPGLFRDLCTQLLRGGQPVRFRATGSSMSPVLCDGDIVTVAPVGGGVRRGDILLYDGDRGLTAHRVIGQRTGGEPVFRVRGDAIGSPVELVEAGRVLGIVQAVERGGRRVCAGRPFVRQVVGLLRKSSGLLIRVAGSRNRVKLWRGRVRLSAGSRGITS